MTLSPRLRDLALTAHVAVSVGWLGAAAAYLALALAALASQDPERTWAAYLAMEPIAWFALVPLALASLLTGLVMSLGTTWGLFRHYWVLFKLVLTALATTVLLAHTGTVSSLAELAATRGHVHPRGLVGEILHAGGGVLVLLAATALAVLKPKGMTSDRRRWKGEHAGAHMGSGPAATPGTPRWVKVFGGGVLVLVLMPLVLLLVGRLLGHGPGGH